MTNEHPSAAVAVQPPTAALLLERSNDWMWAVDASGRHTYSNSAIADLLGYSAEDLLSIPDFTTLVHPDDRAAMSMLLTRSVAERSGWTSEVFRWRRSDGTYRWLESNGNPVYDGGGRLAGFCGADRDITTRIEQERLVAESERRFRLTFERAGVGIAHVAVDGRWLRVNEPLCEMLGYSRDELMSLTFQDITHPDDLDADLAEAQRLFAGEIRAYSIEKRYIRRNGTIVWATLTGSVVRDETGAVDYAIAVVRDITERKRSEAARRQAEKDYRTLFESSHDLVLLIDPENGTIISANRRALEVYGYSVDEIVGLSMSRLASDVDRGREQVRRVMAGAPEVRFESIHRRRDGSAVHLHAALAVVDFGGREVVLATYRDATEEDRLLRALSASERRLRQIIEHGYDAIQIVDETGVVRFASGAALATFGYTAEKLVGRPLSAAVHPEERETVEELFREVAATPDARRTVVCRVPMTDGRTRWCEGTGVNMLGVEGVEGIVVIARDVTDRRELETRLEQSRRVESLGQVAATVAHEFNNVLMTLQTITELVARKHAAAADVLRLAEQLRAAVQRGRSIAAGILRFSNPSTPVRQRLQVGPWLSKTADELRHVVGAGVALTCTAAPSLAIDGDPEQLHQLVTNLVLNAADAIGRSGTIAIDALRTRQAAPGEPWVEIAVTDSGPGIPPDLHSRIFDPLFTTKRNGTGLGLSVCQQIAAAHGGMIRVEAQARGGAVFVVSLPAAVEETSPARQRPRMLLIEDDDLLAAALISSLEDLYDIEWSSDGKCAIQKVRALEPDLVLLDIQLPDADGRAIYRRIRQESLTPAVVLTSGSIRVDPRDLDPRATFLPKPFSTEELLGAVATLAA